MPAIPAFYVLVWVDILGPAWFIKKRFLSTTCDHIKVKIIKSLFPVLTISSALFIIMKDKYLRMNYRLVLIN